MKRQTGRWNRLSSYKTDVETLSDGIAVRYHGTRIVHAEGDYVSLNTGGWQSVTTKRKMNQASNEFDLGYSVHQSKHVWYVTTKAGCYEFDDRVFVFNRNTGIPAGASFPEIAVAAARAAA